MDWLRELSQWLVLVTDQLGYLGLFVMTFVEATFLPVPAEATMIPAGYLVQQGKWDFFTALIVSTIGTVGGSYFNYWIARKYGRELFIRHGRIFMMNDAKLAKFERFFAEHGVISTFTGRLMPGLRHYISLPAGLARMDLKKFFIYTTLGAVVLMAMLLWIGYYIGANEGMAKHYLPYIKLGIVTAVALMIAAYIGRHYQLKKGQAADETPKS